MFCCKIRSRRSPVDAADLSQLSETESREVAIRQYLEYSRSMSRILWRSFVTAFVLLAVFLGMSFLWKGTPSDQGFSLEKFWQAFGATSVAKDVLPFSHDCRYGGHDLDFSSVRDI